MSDQLPMNQDNLIDEDEFLRESQANEAFKTDESVIPFLRVLQPLSDLTAPGAAPGNLLHLANNRVIDGKVGVTVVPILHEWNFTEWVKREEGGGLVRNWGQDEAGWKALCEPDQKFAYQPVTRDGHIILKSRHFFSLCLIEEDVIDTAIIPFSGTALKVARQWSSMMQNAPKIKTSKGMVVPAHFYYLYKLTTEEVKKQSYRWYLPKIQMVTDNGRACSVVDLKHGKDIWKQCIDFRDSFKAGTIRAAEIESNETADDDTI